MTFVVLWVLLSIGAGAVANAKGRSGFGYFMLALVLSPLVGFLIALAMPSLMYVDAAGVRRRMMSEDEYKRATAPPLTDEEKWARQKSNIAVVLIALAIPATFIVLGMLGVLPH
jgi:phosphate/sulfate permease